MSQRGDQESGQESDAAARQRRLEALRALAAAPPPPAPASAPPVTASSAPSVSPSGALPTPATLTSPDTPPAAFPAARPTDLSSMVISSARRRRAREAPSAPSAPAARRARRVPVALRVGLALVAGVVGVAIGALLWLHRPAPAAPAPDPLVFRFNSATMACPQTVAWSPDGTKVAVLGYLACNGSSNFGGQPQPSTGGTLLLYNAATGHLDGDIALDSTTETLLPSNVRSDPNAVRNVTFTYDTLWWSPNGRQLAIRFSADDNSNVQYNQNGIPTGAIHYGQGLLVVAAASHAVTLLTQPAPPQINYAGTSFDQVTVERWDMTAGTSTLTTLPQALAYQWNSDDTLAPTIPLPTTSTAPAPQAPPGAVGNPDGGTSFTVWQTGYVNFGQFCTTSSNPYEQQTCCPITTYLSGGFWAFGAWSPDGRVLLIPYGNGIGANGKLAAPAGTPAPTSQPGCPLPGQEDTHSLVNLPVRDAAMAGVIQSLVPQPNYAQSGPPPSTTAASGASFIWSPDGRRVVVTDQASGPPESTAPVFSIYDTASGKQSASFNSSRLTALAHLPANEQSQGQTVYISTTLWSPDSQRLLLLDPGDHTMLILGAKSLVG